MKNLIIVGAGDFGYEILSWFPGTFAAKDMKFKGFIDDQLDKSKTVLGTIENYVPEAEDVFICAIGEPKVKEKVVTALEHKGAQFINFVHQNTVITSDLSAQRGLIIAPFSFVSCNVQLGNHVILNVSCSVGHDVIISDYATLSPLCAISGHVILGERTFLGSNASIIPGRQVGHDAVIGAGAAVIRDVAPGVTVVGVPAKELTRAK